MVELAELVRVVLVAKVELVTEEPVGKVVKEALAVQEAKAVRVVWVMVAIALQLVGMAETEMVKVATEVMETARVAKAEILVVKAAAKVVEAMEAMDMAAEATMA
jgi:hypothetical protein